jgi:hypothetical protein
MRVSRNQVRAFTILELIVALAVTVLMIVMINALFQATSDGVSVGIALSDVIGAARAAGEQIERDGQAMIPPKPQGSGGGLLVVICNKSEPMPFMERRFLKTRRVRMDQVMWVREANINPTKPELIATAPMNTTTYSPPSPQQLGSATYAKVWYGHVRKTKPDGGTPTALGQPGANRVANNLALGRHMLLMCTDSNAVSTFNRAATAAHDAAVSNMTHPALGSLQLFHGTTDVTSMPYTETATAAGVIGTQAGGSLLYGSMPDASYADTAMKLMFYDSTTRGPMLWVNAVPAFNPANPYQVGEIAQRHALFLDNVSDFIVEVAADFENDPALDVGQGFDGVPDVFTAGVSQGETIWYGLENNDASNSRAFPANWGHVGTFPKKETLAGSDVAFVFRHDRPQTWPYMIRIRYRVHDLRGELLGDRSPERELTDNTGTNVGKWFEQIIHVRRD